LEEDAALVEFVKDKIGSNVNCCSIRPKLHLHLMNVSDMPTTTIGRGESCVTLRTIKCFFVVNGWRVPIVVACASIGGVDVVDVQFDGRCDRHDNFKMVLSIVNMEEMAMVIK
jgi:hypothetical protein